MSVDKTQHSFLENLGDITKRYGLKAASVGFTIGSALMAQKFFQGADPLILRNIAAPIALVTGSIAGFFGYERTNNTCSMIGAGALALSFGGADGEAASYGLCALNILGVVAMGRGSHLVPSKIKQREETGVLKSVMHDGKTQTALSQIIGNGLLLVGAITGNKADMILPFACWTLASMTKTVRAGWIANDKINKNNEINNIDPINKLT
jgi:hypothetical protein